jgi:hypothetical protein
MLFKWSIWVCVCKIIKFYLFIYLFIYWQYWEFELRSLLLLDRHYTTWATLTDFLCWLVSRYGLTLCSGWLVCTVIFLFVFPCITRMKGICHHTYPLVEMGVFWILLLRLASNHDPPNFCLPSSLNYKLESLLMIEIYFNHTVTKKHSHVN